MMSEAHIKMMNNIMINLKLNKNMKGSHHGLTYGSIQHLLVGTEESHKNPARMDGL